MDDMLLWDEYDSALLYQGEDKVDLNAEKEKKTRK